MMTLFGLLVVACNESEDLVTADAVEGGLTSSSISSTGALLGNPDPETGEVVFVETRLDYSINIASPNEEEISSVKIYKQLRDETVLLKDSSAYPIDVNFSEIDEFLEGFSLEVSDLEIGDVFSFYAVTVMADGRELLQVSNEFSVTVQCLSDLEGSYILSGLRDDGFAYGPYAYTVEEIAPGQYQGSRSGAWGPGASFFTTGEARILFNDVCAELFVPSQQLNLGQYSNGVYGEGNGEEVTGSVDLETGVITLVYTIEFSSGNSVYTETITPN